MALVRRRERIKKCRCQTHSLTARPRTSMSSTISSSPNRGIPCQSLLATLSFNRGGQESATSWCSSGANDHGEFRSRHLGSCVASSASYTRSVFAVIVRWVPETAVFKLFRLAHSRFRVHPAQARNLGCQPWEGKRCMDSRRVSSQTPPAEGCDLTVFPPAGVRDRSRS